MAQPRHTGRLRERGGQRRIRLDFAQHPQLRRSGDQGLDELAPVTGVAEATFADAVQIDQVGVRRAVESPQGIGHALGELRDRSPPPAM